MNDETLRVLVRDYRYAAYDVGARGKGSGRDWSKASLSDLKWMAGEHSTAYHMLIQDRRSLLAYCVELRKEVNRLRRKNGSSKR